LWLIGAELSIRTQLLNTRGIRDVQTHRGNILNVLSYEHGAAFKDEDAVVTGCIAETHVFRYDCTESASANDNQVKWSCLDLGPAIRSHGCWVGAVYSFIKTVADIPAEDIACEIRRLWGRARGHNDSLVKGGLRA
jgi:hypothetical protein